MKTSFFRIKLHILFLCITVVCFIHTNAQDSPVDSYLKQAGYSADIYNGKVEEIYNPGQYKSLPYYVNAELTETSIVYRKNYYPNQKGRIDLFKEQLVIVSPGKRYAVVVDSMNLERAYMYGKTFIWLTPPKDSGLKSGYYIQLLEGENIQLLCKEKYYPRKNLTNEYVIFYFDHEIRYYLQYNGKYYMVKNSASFFKLFPQYKKQINKFSKDHKLNFKNNPDESFTSLAAYCEELTYIPSQINEDIDDSFKIPVGEDDIDKVQFFDEEEPDNEFLLTYEVQDTIPENIPQTDKEEKINFASSENLIYSVGDPYLKTIPDEIILKGKIIDAKSRNPLPGVKLVSKEPYIITTTDNDGNYTIKLPAGRVQLDISGFNIKNSRRQLMLYDSGIFNIEMIEDIYQLDEVSIIAQRTDNVKSIRLGTEKIQVSKIKNIPTAFGEVDILKVIQSLPGVKTVGEASTGFNVRGGATDQNLILLNNGTIYNPNHLFGFFTAFSSDMLNDAELFKSSIPAQYGGRISSVLDITGKEANKEKFTGSAGIGLVTSKLNLEIPIIKERTSVLLSGRTTYSDWILKKLPEKSGYNSGTAGFYDVGTVISHRINEKNFFNVYGYYSRDRFEFNAQQKYAYSNMNVSAKWKRIFNDKLLGNFAVGYDHYDYKNTDSTNVISAYRLSFNINQLFAKADFIYDRNDHQLNFGLKSMLYDINPGTYKPAGDNSLVKLDVLQKEKALESALYIEDQWNITQKLSVTGGIRFSIFNALGPRSYYKYDPNMLPYESTVTDSLNANSGKIFKTYIGPEFRLSARYILADNLSVKAGFNTMRQYIHKLSNTVIMSPTDTWKLSDENIRPQKGWQIATGLFYNNPKRIWVTSMEVYYKKMNDYLDYRSGAKILMNPHIETDVINTEGYAYGVELSLKKEVGKLNGWVSYTYSRTFLRQSDKLIAQPVNDGNWYPTDYDKPHDFKLTGNYKFTQRYSCSVNIDYSTGRPTTIPDGKYYDAESNTIQVFYSDRNSHRIPDYFRMDLSFNIEPSHKLTLLTHSSVSLGVYNLTGRKNVYSIYYVSENKQVKGYKLSIFGVPIPFITYNIKF